MTSKLKFCEKCRTYTLNQKCEKCKSKTKPAGYKFIKKD
jgi:rRNA maturation protein Nop10